jgi:cation transport regulator
MPYSQLSELPDNVSKVLPKHAQEIYQEAFNSAWQQYAKPQDRHSDDSREEVAHKVAWSAVKHSYHKNQQGNWVKN